MLRALGHPFCCGKIISRRYLALADAYAQTLSPIPGIAEEIEATLVT